MKNIPAILVILTALTGCSAFPNAAQIEAKDLLKAIQIRDDNTREACISDFREKTQFQLSGDLIREMALRGGEWQGAAFAAVAVLQREECLPPDLQEAYFIWLLREPEAHLLNDDKERVAQKYPIKAFKALVRSLEGKDYRSPPSEEMEYIENSAAAFSQNFSPKFIEVLVSAMSGQVNKKFLQKCCWVLYSILGSGDEIPREILEELLPVLFSHLKLVYPAGDSDACGQLLGILKRQGECPDTCYDQPVSVLIDLTDCYIGSKEVLPFLNDSNPAVRIMVIKLVLQDLEAFAVLQAMKPQIEKDPDQNVKSYYEWVIEDCFAEELDKAGK